MRVVVKVKPGAKRDHVEVGADGTLVVQVKAPPIDGRANEAVAALLAQHFGVKRGAVTLRQGASNRNKVFEVSGLA
ncbi:MAG: DUF167 domain-containing protein [Bryobacterales bacterium]|nr:DUF167 domain-containing protein [Bryobacterales bacterium]